MPAPSDSLIARAKALARSLHRPVYISEDRLTTDRPRGGGLTVWPSGSVSMGTANTAQVQRDVERRNSPPAA